jgi:peptidoglycan/LPS O-acetylase OafA/YrhL
MWSVVVEASFYLALPLIGWLALRLGARRHAQLALCVCVFAFGTACMALARIEMWPESARATLPLLLGYFAAGMTVAVVAHRRAWSRTAGAALIAAGCAVVVGNSIWHVHHELPLRHHLHDTPAAIGFALVIAGLVATPLRPRMLVCAPVRALGTISFGIYLWHFPTIVLLRNRGWWPQSFVAEATATLAVAAIAATISWFAVERPALRWAHRPRTASDGRSSNRAERPRPPAGAAASHRRPGARSHAAESCDVWPCRTYPSSVHLYGS